MKTPSADQKQKIDNMSKYELESNYSRWVIAYPHLAEYAQKVLKRRDVGTAIVETAEIELDGEE